MIDAWTIIKQALPYFGLGLLAMVLIIAIFFGNSIRNAKRERQTEAWQNSVEPRWSNVSDADFDSLRHLLGQSAKPPEREDVVVAVVRRHIAMLYFGSVPSALLLTGSITLLVINTVSLRAAWFAGLLFVQDIDVPVWVGGIVLLVWAMIAFMSIWVKWRYRYYLLTNYGVHIADVLPVKLAFIPGDTRMLMYSRVGLARQDDSFVGNACGYATVRLGTNMGDEEDGPFNDMDFMPKAIGFVDAVKAHQPSNETSPSGDA